MVKKILRYVLFCAMVAAMTMLTGCFTMSAEDFYRLPQLSDEYVQLQDKINDILDNGAEYSAPTSGSYRQAVQLQDVDGDGQDEAVAFFSVSGSDKPMKIIIFKSDGGTYKEVARIEGQGTDIDSINYINMGGDGYTEILVGWQISSDVKMLSVYSTRDYQQLFSTIYSEYAVSDLTGDGGADVMAVQMSGSNSGEVEMYSLSRDGEVVTSTARLTGGVESISRIRTKTLRGGASALLIESKINSSSIVTDIFTYIGNSIVNITADPTTGISKDTIRTYSVYSTDINKDGVIEVPHPVQLFPQSDTTSYWKIEWYSYNRSGSRTLEMTTYHNFSDGWYLVLPKEWGDTLTVRREDTVSGERTIIFSFQNKAGEIKDFLAIYTLSGMNKVDQAAIEGRFTLRKENETIYAAKILDSRTDMGVITEDLIRNNFNMIYSDWITGET